MFGHTGRNEHTGSKNVDTTTTRPARKKELHTTISFTPQFEFDGENVQQVDFSSPANVDFRPQEISRSRESTADHLHTGIIRTVNNASDRD